MATILVAEDDKNVQLLIQARLQTHFDVVCADDGVAALAILDSRRVDLVVADVMMPRMDGFTLVREVRARGLDLPILILTARQSLGDKHQGFDAGTDDYMTKPIQYEELLWRIQALLRRARIRTERKVSVGDLVLDAEAYVLRHPGGSLEFPKKEFELLFRLVSSPGRIFTKDQLLEEFWGNETATGEETIKTHISRIRSRLEGFPAIRIVTVKGLGYKAEVSGGAR